MAPEKRLFVAQYYPQRDSATRHGDRMCFSSTVAMAIKFLKPSALKGSNADDDYLRTVLKYGDTIEAQTQIRAMRDYGIIGTFTKKAGSIEAIKREIDAGYPVGVGFLHHGPVSAPRGGGHWILVIGYTDTHVIVHDPFGELDVVRGGYFPGRSGKNQKYTWRNWTPRWDLGGEQWMMTFRRIEEPKPAEVPIQRTFPNTWEGVVSAARVAGAKLPEVVAAQWALESGWGKAPSGKNNFFGIKGSPGTSKQTREFVNGKWITITDTFKDFDTLYDCVEYLVTKWYKDYKNFKGVNRARTASETADLLVREGYATDPRYASKLKDILSRQLQ